VADPKGAAPLTVYTTWNRISKAAANLGSYPGLVPLLDDVPARLMPLVTEQEVKIPGWLEIEIQDHIGNYGPCFYDGSGQATTLAAWVPHLPPNANREGVAVHEDILFYLG